jgi:glucosamine-6-phosphate deaminase
MAAAEHAAERLRELAQRSEVVSVVFATGASQLTMLRALTVIPNLPWERVIGFHMDEYLGISAAHPASFRRYLREELVNRVPLRDFRYIEGDSDEPAAFCHYYAAELCEHPPQLCLLGIGENGHLAFNDPGEADFGDPEAVRIVRLDNICRQQQVNEGWFASMDDVPKHAITLTVPVLMAIPEIIASVPGKRKAAIVRRFFSEAISTDLPATILRRHPNVMIFLDRDSAAYVE